jgi:hypothetical protein
VVGTARYLAPEQVNSQPVDSRADVYALGLLLYEMLTGKAPFAGDTEMATAVARLTNAPEPVSSARPDVPRPLEDAVARSLARDPEYRYQSAQAFKDALTGDDAAPTGPLAPPRPPPPAPAPRGRGPARPQPRAAPVPPRRARRWPWVLLILVLLAAGAAAAYALASRNGDSDAGGTATSAAAADQTLPIVSVSDFDPEGDGSESPGSVGNASDGNPSTAWSTETYEAPRTDFGGNKSGVGLIFELDGPHEVAAVTVTADDSDWNADIYVADQSGSELPAWGPPRASRQGLGREAQFPIDPNASGRFVLLWLTRLPTDGKLGINEVAIAGR